VVAGNRTGSSTERIVASVFGEAFGVDDVDSDSDFFQLGGSSLVAADVMEHLRELFGMELPVRYLFETPTVGALAALIDEAKEGKGMRP
jgi:acyl carrier protein